MDWVYTTLYTERRLQRDEMWTLKVEIGVGCVVYSRYNLPYDI